MVDIGVPDICVTNVPSEELTGRCKRFLSCCGELDGLGRFKDTGGWESLCANWDMSGLDDGLCVPGLSGFGSVIEEDI